MSRRIFVSAPSTGELDDRRRALKEAIIRKLRRVSLEPQQFFESGMPFEKQMGWNFGNVDAVMRRCSGAMVLGFPRWVASEAGSTSHLVTEYSHFEGAVAYSRGLPVFLLAEREVADRGVVGTGGGRLITYMPLDAGESWIESPEFLRPFDAWREEMTARYDVFLGYCSRSEDTAYQIQKCLQQFGATVMNYQMDFRAGRSILQEIENACAICSTGVFLFSEDDPLEGGDGAAPRDNVVFEAGFFISAKGADRCLIIRRGKAKIPADLGGAIYEPLGSRTDVGEIKERLERFLENSL